MAALPACQVDIRSHGGVELLVRFLHERPSPGVGRVELAACERVQQKAAIALSRVCHGDSGTDKLMHAKGETLSVSALFAGFSLSLIVPSCLQVFLCHSVSDCLFLSAGFSLSLCL